MTPPIRVGLQNGDFDLAAEILRCRDVSLRAGGLVTFLGTVRDLSDDRGVERLEFESFPGMAEEQLALMAAEAVERFGLTAVTLLHRVGRLDPGENIVLIVAAAGHREEAFSGCRWCIDELKRRIPIWKKEVYGNGQAWVQETP